MPKPFVVAFLGGSITWGSGASDPERTSYRALVAEHLRSRLPHRPVAVLNAAIGGTGSDFGLFRLRRHVLEAAPDLVFVEFAVNDDGMGQAWRQRSFESLLRLLVQDDDHPLLVVVLTTRATYGAEDAASHASALGDHRTIAAHYGVSVIDAGAFLRDQAAPLETFLPDGVHPNDAGYRLYADAIIAGLESLALERKPDQSKDLPLHGELIERVRMVAADESPFALDAPVVHLPSPDFPLAWSLSPGAEPVAVDVEGGIVGLVWWVSSDAGSIGWRLDEGDWHELACWDEYAPHFDRIHPVVLTVGPAARSLQIAALETPVPGSLGLNVRIAAVFFAQQAPERP